MPDINTVVVTPTVSVVQVNSSVPGSYDTLARLGLGWMDVTDPLFGATGNGTTDDSAAIQAAHDALSANGGILYFPPGVYLCSGLTISKTSVSIVTMGGIRAARFRFTNTTGTLFTVTGALFKLEGFEFESPSATHTAGAVFDIQAGQGLVRDIRINGSFFDVFKLETSGAGNWGFDWVRVSGGNTMNSLFKVKGTSSTVASNHVTNLISASSATYSDAAIILDTYTDTFTVTNGELGGNGVAVHIRDTGASQDPRYIRFTDVFIEAASSTGTGILIDAGDDIRFRGCYTALHPIAVQVNAGRDIQFQGHHFISIPQMAVDLNGGTRVAFLDCTFLDASTETTLTYSTIDVAAGVSEWRVERNTFRVRSGISTRPLRQLTIASGASTKFVYGDNDWGVSGTDYGSAGDNPVSDASTGTNVVIHDSIPTALQRGGDAVSLTGTTSATVLKTVTIPGGALRTRDGVRVVAGGTSAGTNNTKTVTVSFGGSTVGTIVIPAANADSWMVIADVFNNTTLTGQIYVSWFTRTPNGTEGSVSRVQSGNLTVTTTSDVVVALTGTLANAGDTLVCRTFHQEILRR